MKPVLTELITSKKFIATIVAIVVCVGGKIGLDLDPELLSQIFTALLVYVGAQGIADMGKSAAQAKAVSDNASTSTDLQAALKRMATRIPTSLIAVVGAVALLQASCAPGPSVGKPTLTTSLGAFLDCESVHLDDDAVADVRAFADDKVKEWSAGGARPSSAEVRELLSRLHSDLGRCAIAGAVAAATSIWKARASASATSESSDLRGTFVDAARGLGWGPIRLRDGTILGR